MLTHFLQPPFPCYSHITTRMAIYPVRYVTKTSHYQSVVIKTVIQYDQIIIYFSTLILSYWPALSTSSYRPRKKATQKSDEKQVKNWKVNILTVKLFSVAANDLVSSGKDRPQLGLCQCACISLFGQWMAQSHTHKPCCTKCIIYSSLTTLLPLFTSQLSCFVIEKLKVQLTHYSQTQST